ncbi:HDOD domain-containing protein [bacterium]|nr:HDOD domain-containing protein [bacterium]
MTFLQSISRSFQTSPAKTKSTSPETGTVSASSEPAPPVLNEKIFIARQPIFDKNINVYGYELLFRDGQSNSANVTDNDTATQNTLINALVEFGLNDLIGNYRGFINLGPQHVFGDFPFTEYRDRLVLEILESIPIDASLVRAATKLKSQGYLIALDDVFVRPETELLFPIVDIVKIDLTLIPRDDLARQMAILKKFPNLKVLAEKVEEPETYKQCRDLGCEYFQGYFFARPKTVVGKKIPESRIAVLRLIAELQNPNVSVAEIERLIKQDASLSYKLLKYINSAMTGVAQQINNVRQAITLLGLSRIRVLATMLGLAHGNDKPHELLVTALVRARTCELVATRMRLTDPSSLFVVGLFSLLDAMLDQPLDLLMKQLPLAEPIRQAILAHQGEMGKILNEVTAFEQGDWTTLQQDPAAMRRTRESYMEGLRWTAALQPDLFFEKS